MTIGIVAEGITECNFVKKLLCPYFIGKDKYLFPITIVTSRDKRNGKVYKGGGLNFDRVKVHIGNQLKNCDVVSTMFDFYGLPPDFPGVAKINKNTNAYDQVTLIEDELTGKICTEKFIPYIQLHEFEALVFSDLDILQKQYFENKIEPLRKCLAEIKNPELINTDPNKSLSKRIINYIKEYDKATIGVRVLEEIGLNKIRSECKHFDEWICKLEEL